MQDVRLCKNSYTGILIVLDNLRKVFFVRPVFVFVFFDFMCAAYLRY